MCVCSHRRKYAGFSCRISNEDFEILQLERDACGSRYEQEYSEEELTCTEEEEEEDEEEATAAVSLADVQFSLLQVNEYNKKSMKYNYKNSHFSLHLDLKIRSDLFKGAEP